MSIDQIGFQQAQPHREIQKSEQSNQQSFNSHMDKLFLSHNMILTRILQNGLKIPQHLMEKIKREASNLKKIYFGLDNHILDPQLLPKDQGEFVVLYTESMPVIIPRIFFEEDVQKDHILSQKLALNLLDDKNWWEVNPDEIEFSEFLRAALVFFGMRKFVKKEKIKMVHIVTNPNLTEHSIIFSMKCNLFTLLLFFYTHHQYFPTLQAGINAYLKFLKQDK
ncbi:MAG: hypothetical protein PHV30_02265 [Candidatus Margulisbacteria bacterium]|nr:hypothetical protein [Candidatus Margulisiibacteriota bacterium]